MKLKDAGGGQGRRRILVLPLLRWVILLASITYLWTVVNFLLSSAASCTYCFLYTFNYAKWSRLAKRFTQLCALCFDVIALSLTIIRTTFKNLLNYIHATNGNRLEWYEVKGNCLLLWPISCSHSLDTHSLGILPGNLYACPQTCTHILWVSSVSKSTSWALLSPQCKAPGSQAQWGEEVAVQLSHKYGLAVCLPDYGFSLLQWPQICCQSHFPKILLSSGPCPECMIFPAV